MVAKIRLANAVDPEAGGACLASCLNLVVQLNWARVSYRTCPQEMAKQADMVVASAPVLAILVATKQGFAMEPRW